MALTLWLAFATACFILSVIPGPSVLVVISLFISYGWRAALLCIAGELLGGVCLMLASLLGVGAAVAASPAAFLALKWVGVAFLFYMGGKALRAALGPAKKLAPEASKRGSLSAGFWTSVLNPKSLAFYLAFFSQFIDASSPLLQQYALLIFTAVAVAGAVLGAYALIAAKFRPFFCSASAQQKVSGVSGSLYLAGGALAAVSR